MPFLQQNVFHREAAGVLYAWDFFSNVVMEAFNLMNDCIQGNTELRIPTNLAKFITYAM